MCVIAVSEVGARQPSTDVLRAMWDHNPHGAGYMFADGNMVHIHKGFMNWEEFESSVSAMQFNSSDPVVYHFRIATQAGISPAMTHPFPLVKDLRKHRLTLNVCKFGVAHNGIITLTSDRTETKYSDSSLFISRYLTRLIRSERDMQDPDVLDMIYLLARSKFAIMSGSGRIATVGDFYEQPGKILVSNEFYKPFCNIHVLSENLHDIM